MTMEKYGLTIMYILAEVFQLEAAHLVHHRPPLDNTRHHRYAGEIELLTKILTPRATSRRRSWRRSCNASSEKASDAIGTSAS